MTVRALLGALCLSLPLAMSAEAATDPANPDWPCIQRKVPQISAGMVWAGPPLDEAQATWQDDPAVDALVPLISARRTELSEAEAEIAAFAEAAGAERNASLTLLFAGVLDTLNLERARVMEGIERYSRRQRGLSLRISEASIELRDLRRQKSEEVEAKERVAALEEQLTWDTRVFDEREQSLTYVCEIPVLIEQRVFALARAIMNEME